MPRRVSLPGADELFRSTTPTLPGLGSGGEPGAEPSASQAGQERPAGGMPDLRAVPRGDADGQPASAERKPSRRQRHDEKITVYVSAAELVELEKARLTLRADHGLGVDRGRIVREALSVVLADLEAKGDASILVRRLRSS